MVFLESQEFYRNSIQFNFTTWTRHGAGAVASDQKTQRKQIESAPVPCPAGWPGIRPPAVISSVDGSGSLVGDRPPGTGSNNYWCIISSTDCPSHPIPSHLFPLVLFLDPRHEYRPPWSRGSITGHLSSGRASASWDIPCTASLLDHPWSIDAGSEQCTPGCNVRLWACTQSTGDLELEALVLAVRPSYRSIFSIGLSSYTRSLLHHQNKRNAMMQARPGPPELQARSNAIGDNDFFFDTSKVSGFFIGS